MVEIPYSYDRRPVKHYLFFEKVSLAGVQKVLKYNLSFAYKMTFIISPYGILFIQKINLFISKNVYFICLD